MVLTVCAAGVLWLTLVSDGPIPVLPVLVFGAVAFLSESFSVELPGTAAMSVGFVSIIAAIVLCGPSGAAVVAACGAITPADVRAVTSKLVLLVNLDTYIVASVAAGWVYVWTGGRPLLVVTTAMRIPGLLASVFAASAVLFSVNIAAVAIGVLLRHGNTALRDFFKIALHWIPNYAALTVLGFVLAYVYRSASVAGVALAVVPLAVAHQTFQVYMKLREAYQSTVRSLVAAIEAKDAYTRGHSERVADYAEATARQLGMSEDAVDKLKVAALLHDLGKLGIQRRILSKTGRLTEDEFGLMQEHPELATAILRDVSFLEDIIPAIYHHHEHYDGSGYVRNLKGEQIPLTARILAVADAYDAMISARPYRDALTPEMAAAELVSCSGSQFDRKAVDALLAATGVQPQLAEEIGIAEGQLRFVDETT